MLQKIRPDGSLEAAYWNNGHIHQIIEARIGGRRVILVGASSDESGGASLSMLDYERPGGPTPAVSPSNRCGNCLSGFPIAHVVFPRTELWKVTNRGPFMYALDVSPSGDRIVVELRGETPLPGDARPCEWEAIYTLDQNLNIVDATFSDSYGETHSRLQLAGMVDHPYGDHERNQLFPALKWEGERLTTITGPRGAGTPSR